MDRSAPAFIQGDNSGKPARCMAGSACAAARLRQQPVDATHLMKFLDRALLQV